MTAVAAIYTRHERALMTVGAASDVVRFSLRLALEELAQSTTSISSTTDQRQAEQNQAQLNRLNDWLAQHEPAAYTLPGDTADAVLAILTSYRQALTQPSAISNQQSSINNPPFVPPDTAATPNPPPAPLNLDLSSLAPDELQQVAAVQSEEKQWRTLDKPLRIQVASLALRQLAAAKGERITQREWEAQRPPWMPGSGSLTYMYGQSWDAIPQE